MVNDAPAELLGTLIAGAREGDEQAIGRLFELLYDNLHRLAHARLRAAPSPALDTTALVHESYERFAHLARLDVTDRSHFLAYASRVMRSVIVDIAREAFSQRRGGGQVHVTLTTGLGASIGDNSEADILRVHEALEALAEVDARAAQVVEMRYFGGLDHAEIAAALGIGVRTVERDWEKARSYLYATLKQG